MSMVSGLGGAFIFSNDPDRLAGWYTDVFGLGFTSFGEGGTHYLVFYGLDPNDPSTRLDTNFAIMQAKVDIPARAVDTEPDDMYGDQPYMINLRVRDMSATLARFKEKGVRVIKSEDEEYGRFCWVRDADGNRLEIYQPVTVGEASE